MLLSLSTLGHCRRIRHHCLWKLLGPRRCASAFEIILSRQPGIDSSRIVEQNMKAEDKARVATLEAALLLIHMAIYLPRQFMNTDFIA
jgi:hypothetical protein